MDESSPITILIGALVATLVLGIAAQQVNEFGGSASTHSDDKQVNSLINEIETECEKLEDLDELQYSTSTDLDLRNSGLDIDEDSKSLVYNPKGEEREFNIECDHPLNFEADFEADRDVPIGEYEVSIGEENGEIKVEFQ
ncbi:MAG: hypothetical protein ACLFTA_02080 [Candidatus Nanohaloarchaea archaeon]